MPMDHPELSQGVQGLLWQRSQPAPVSPGVADMNSHVGPRAGLNSSGLHAGEFQALNMPAAVCGVLMFIVPSFLKHHKTVC